MTDNIRMGNYDGYNPDRTLLVIDITEWYGPAIGKHCDDCAYDRGAFKCHLAIGRPEHVLLDDDIYYIRPQECKNLEIRAKDFNRIKQDEWILRSYEDVTDNALDNRSK